MSRIKLNLRQLPVPEKIAKARKIVNALSGNTNFPNPTPSLEAITAAINAFDAASAATQATRQDVKTRISEQVAREGVLDQLMNQLAAHVESVAGTSDNLIHSAGMDTKSAPTPPSLPTVPAGLIAVTGDHEGEVDLSWQKVAQGKSYLVEKSPDPPTAASWVHAGAGTKAYLTVGGLTTGTRYWFRVAAIGALGQSGWSNPIARVAA